MRFRVLFAAQLWVLRATAWRAMVGPTLDPSVEAEITTNIRALYSLYDFGLGISNRLLHEIVVII